MYIGFILGNVWPKAWNFRMGSEIKKEVSVVRDNEVFYDLNYKETKLVHTINQEREINLISKGIEYWNYIFTKVSRNKNILIIHKKSLQDIIIFIYTKMSFMVTRDGLSYHKIINLIPLTSLRV